MAEFGKPGVLNNLFSYLKFPFICKCNDGATQHASQENHITSRMHCECAPALPGSCGPTYAKCP